MTEIKPFRAVVYNQEKVSDLTKVVCPPYDVIDEDQKKAFLNESEYNFIRVMLAKLAPNEDQSDQRYNQAKETYQNWLQQGVLQEDENPCIYYYRQEYKIKGQKQSRLGFIALMKIQDDEDAKIYPHENTHSRDKEDRLKLWRTLNSNLSSIFVCYSDKKKKVTNIFSQHVANEQPFMDMVDSEGIRHTLWRLEDPKLIEAIVQSLDNQHLFIADGHHRYEVAKQFRRLKMKNGRANGSEPYNYVMTYFTNMDASRDVAIFPMHRIVKKLPEPLDFLEEYFRIDKIKTKSDLQILLGKAGRNEPAFGLYTKGRMLLLRLKNKLLIDKVIKEGSKEFRRLDATILKYFVFERIGVQSEDIIYTKDFDYATNMVDEGEADASFIMNPVKIQQLRDIALNGERMPPKTTYFYPKVLSGLTVFKMG